jgi:hypothetical protein
MQNLRANIRTTAKAAFDQTENRNWESPENGRNLLDATV